MPSIRLTTFNSENLFARYNFKEETDPQIAINEGWSVDRTKFIIQDPETRKITAQAIKATKSDIIALQEVENLEVLKRFRTEYLGGRSAYPYLLLIDGNDPRLIDVAVMSKYPLVSARSYQHLYNSKSRRYIFSRDCLEIDVEIAEKKTITLYVNHFKSMIGGREQTKKTRALQTATVMEIIQQRFGKLPGKYPFVICGDFNDYADGTSGIDELVSWNQVENVIARLPGDEQWTHFYSKAKEYRQLDYILVSKALAKQSSALPVIERRGMPLRAEHATVKRFSGVDENTHKASDHCPVSFDIQL